jgi:hypothetical protein
MITFDSCFITGKAQGWRTFPKYRASLDMKPSWALYFENVLTRGSLLQKLFPLP